MDNKEFIKYLIQENKELKDLIKELIRDKNTHIIIDEHAPLPTFPTVTWCDSIS